MDRYLCQDSGGFLLSIFACGSGGYTGSVTLTLIVPWASPSLSCHPWLHGEMPAPGA